jgi:hypothetical protein
MISSALVRVPHQLSRYVFVCCCVLFELASANAEQKQHAPEVYAGKIMALSGLLTGKPTDLAVVIGRYSTAEELKKYEQLLSSPDGQSKLAETIGDGYDIGAYRIGTELALAIKIIAVKETDQGKQVMMVGGRIPQGLEMQGKLTPRDYRFVVVKLNLDAKGNGEGSYIPSAKLHFSKDHILEVEDYQTQPAPITNIRAVHK